MGSLPDVCKQVQQVSELVVMSKSGSKNRNAREREEELDLNQNRVLAKGS